LPRYCSPRNIPVRSRHTDNQHTQNELKTGRGLYMYHRGDVTERQICLTLG